MNRILVVLSSLIETAWALGVSVSAGLLLLSWSDGSHENLRLPIGRHPLSGLTP